MKDPFQWAKDWVAEEGDFSLFAVLATVDRQSKPHTRTIAVREIDERGILFFTQKGSKKVRQAEENPAVSLTFYLPRHKRQITFRGSAKPLSEAENTGYWKSCPPESRLRFLVCGPRSGERIIDNGALDRELEELRKNHPDQILERPESYVGYRIHPDVCELYQLNDSRLSDSFLFERKKDVWGFSRVVP